MVNITPLPFETETCPPAHNTVFSSNYYTKITLATVHHLTS